MKEVYKYYENDDMYINLSIHPFQRLLYNIHRYLIILGLRIRERGRENKTEISADVVKERKRELHDE